MTRGLRWILAASALPALGATGLIVAAAIAEPPILTGEAHRAAPEVRAYADAERALFARFGIEARPRAVTLREPALRVHVLEVPGAGTPVVLVHGGGGTAAQWAPLLPELRGRPLYLVDRPGCGLTEGFDYEGVDVKRHAVSFVGGVLDALGITKAVLLGNSMGGLWSLWFAAEQPERVEALVLAGCPALFLGTSAPVPMRLLALPGLGQAMMALQPSGADGARKGLAMVLGEPTAAKADPLLIEAAARGAAIPGARRSFRTLLARALTLSGARPEMAFGAADLARVRAPLLLLWGRDDVFGEPSAIDRARAARPDLAAEVLPGGHLPWLDDPARCGRSVRGFLDGRLAAATVRAPPAAAPIPAP